MLDSNNRKSSVLTKQDYQFMNTIQENLKCLSPRQQKPSKETLELYEYMITPTVDNLKAMIRMNIINKNKVTTDDKNLETKSYGPDVG